MTAQRFGRKTDWPRSGAGCESEFVRDRRCLSQTEIGTDPIAIRDFAQAVEEMGFAKLLAYDHIVGADFAERPGWGKPYTHVSTFHEPLTLQCVLLRFQTPQ
jgi:hypothetical protein